MALLHLVALGCAVGLLCHRYKRRLEEALPVVVALGIFALYLLAMARALAWVDLLAALMVAGTALYACYQLRSKPGGWRRVSHFARSYLLTPGLVAAFLTGLLWWYLTSVRYVYNSDDLNYWAVQAKSLWYSQGLVDGLHHCAPRFSSYTPGMQLVAWWYMHLAGSWTEGVLYFAQFFTNVLWLLPLLRRSTFRQWWAVPLFVVAAVCGPTALSNTVYCTLWTDNTLGFLFGYVLYQLWHASQGDRMAPLAVGAALCALVLTKQTGMLWVAAALAFFLLVRRPQGQGLSAGRWALAFAAPLAAQCSWLLFCQVQGLGSYLTSYGTDSLRALLQGSYQRPNGIGLVLKHIVRVFFTMPPNTHGYWGGAAYAGLPMALWLVLFAAVPLLCRRAAGEESPLAGKAAKRMALYGPVLGLCYLLAFAFSFFTLFYSEVGYWAESPVHVASLMDRYFMPFYFGMAYLSVGLVLDVCHGRLRKLSSPWLTRALPGGLMALLLLFTNWQMMGYMNPHHYSQQPREGPSFQDMRDHTDWFQALGPEGQPEARVLLCSSYPSFTLAYALVPTSVVELPQAVLDSSSPLEALVQFVGENRVTHVVAQAENNATYRLVESVLGLRMAPGCLYQVRWDGETLALTPAFDGK